MRSNTPSQTERLPMNQRRLSALAAILASSVAAPLALARSAVSAVPPPAPPEPVSGASPARPPKAVTEWNRTLLKSVRTKSPIALQPATIHAPRAFTILHLAIYDAVVAVDGGKPYLREHILTKPASAPAAADH